ncbi:hypothetical protein [Acidithiobacillus sulfuriphilus]|uniref:hypothetical protein n=1 Tax=Acidithiobacillus sulfuriphilus TaxID=1867749 RepID=UPI003F60DBE0
METGIDADCHRISGSRSDNFRLVAEIGFCGLSKVDGAPKDKAGKQECQSDENGSGTPKDPAVAAEKGPGFLHAHARLKRSRGKDGRALVGDDIRSEFPATFYKVYQI